MKQHTMKKLLALVLALALCLAMTACGSKTNDSAAQNTTESTDTQNPAEATDAAESTESTDAPAASYKIAVVKQMDHASLDEIANAITARLDEIAKENNVSIEYEVYSGQGEQSVLKQIGDQAISDGADAIIPIATLAAQVMTVCAADTATPVVFAANTNDEVITAASVLISEGVDAVFTPTDNIIMAAELAIAGKLAEAGIPHYTGADSFVRNGAFATCGVNYTELGAQTADLAYQAITEGMEKLDDYYVTPGGIITVNTETAATLNADYSMFSDLGEVVEVTTTEE